MRRGSRKDLMIVQGQPVMGLIGVMRRALAYWRPYWVQGLLIVAATLLQQAFNTFLALSLKLIIDRALAARDGVLLLWILTGLAGGFIVALLATLCADYLTARVGANILNDLRLKMFGHLQRLSMDFFQRARTGNIVAYFSSDLAGIEPGRAPRPTGRAGGWGVARAPRSPDRRHAGRFHEPAVEREQGCVQPDQEGRSQLHHGDRGFAADRRPAEPAPPHRRRKTRAAPTPPGQGDSVRGCQFQLHRRTAPVEPRQLHDPGQRDGRLRRA